MFAIIQPEPLIRLNTTHTHKNTASETRRFRSSDVNPSPSSDFTAIVIAAITDSPEENPSGFDLGYSDTREFAILALEELDLQKNDGEFDMFVAQLLRHAKQTPGGTEFANLVFQGR